MTKNALIAEMTNTSVNTPSLLANPAQLKNLLALNNTHAAELSWLELPIFHRLIEQSFATCVVGDADAFLIALDQSADYDNPNFHWFAARYSRFVYVDRIVVAEVAQGGGCARRLYEHLFAAARQAGHQHVVCEINADPPNPKSDAFHAALGFQEVGSAVIHAGTKAVRYFLHALTPNLPVATPL